MLSAMRRNSRHAIIYVLFGILIAAFVISFGPGSRGFGYQGVTSAYAVKVAGASDSSSIRAGMDKIKDFEAPNGKITYAGFNRRPLVRIAYIGTVGGGAARAARQVRRISWPSSVGLLCSTPGAPKVGSSRSGYPLVILDPGQASAVVDGPKSAQGLSGLTEGLSGLNPPW